MAPLKFDDFSKKIKDIFTIDYSASYGQELKAKQKLGSIGAVLTTTVTLNPKKEGATSTPAKLSMKWPKPCGLVGFNIDKLEYSPKGDFKLETSLNKDIHKVDGLELELKSNLVDTKSFSAGANFSGIKDTRFTFETSPLAKEQDFKLTVSRDQGPASLGCSINKSNLAAPDLGLRISQSGILACLMATDQFKTFEGHAHYKVNADLEVALNGKQSKKGLTASAGIVYKINDITIKAKVDEKGGVDTVTNYSPAKGVNFLIAGKYKDGTPGYGIAVSIE